VLHTLSYASLHKHLRNSFSFCFSTGDALSGGLLLGVADNLDIVSSRVKDKGRIVERVEPAEARRAVVSGVQSQSSLVEGVDLSVGCAS